ncbi:MAG: hypothetical protein WBV61_02240 [Rhodanobacteraceae bacterium]
MSGRNSSAIALTLLAAVLVIAAVVASRPTHGAFENVAAGSTSVAASAGRTTRALSLKRNHQPLTESNAADHRDVAEREWRGKQEWADYEASTNLVPDLNDLAARINQGDAQAMGLAASILVECNISKFFSPNDLPAINQGRLKNGLPPMPQTIWDEQQRRCGDIAAERKLPVHAERDLIRDAAKAGDPVGLALDFANSPPVEVKEGKNGISKILASGNPYAIFRMGDLMARFGVYGKYSGDVDDRYAWQFVACDLGMDCSPSSAIVRETCMQGSCSPGGYKDLVQESLVSPVDYQRIVFLEQEILTQYLAGNIDALLQEEE